VVTDFSHLEALRDGAFQLSLSWQPGELTRLPAVPSSERTATALREENLT
jgi:hypothetical protein